MKTLALVIAICSSALTSGVACAPADSVVIREIQLLGEPTELGVSGLQSVGDVWSVYDFRDSIVIRVIVDGGDESSPEGLLLSEVQLRVGRNYRLPDDPEIVDRDLTESNAIWTPSFESTQVPLSSGIRNDDNQLVIHVATLIPDRILRNFRNLDSELALTGLRVRAFLLVAGSTPSSNVVSEKRIRLAMGH